MTWYAETPGKRTAQQLGDAAVVGWIALWLWIGNAVHDAVRRLAAPGRELEEAGDGLAGGLRGAAERAADVPVVGDELRVPLDTAAGAGDAVARAGIAQQEAVGTLALVLAVVLAGLPITIAVLRWLPGRLQWSRDVHAARALRGDVELLALRAAASQPMPALAKLGPDPVTRWRGGDQTAARQLAALELRRLGLRASGGEGPPDDASPPSGAA